MTRQYETVYIFDSALEDQVIAVRREVAGRDVFELACNVSRQGGDGLEGFEGKEGRWRGRSQ